MDDGKTGALLGHFDKDSERGEGKKRFNLCFSPVLELALFFGMTSAETDEVQVGFSRWGQDRGVALLYSVVISLQSTSFTELCICPLPYMVFTWD